MSSDALFREYRGQIVPQDYNAGFVALSYLVSLVGAASTLELINRRTGSRGIFNHLLLVSSAITMGGIAIWCMHFIGNRAIDLADGQAQLQAAYSSGFTAVSFFVPIVVLLAAFIAIGTNNRVSWWRVSIGGVLCGTAVCGMHYLGNASIANYACVYRPAYVIGSAIIAVVASIIALAMFFVFRAAWATSWWKRAISAVILAGAVSGMHWCAAVGTQYRLINTKPEGNEPSRSATVVVVICLSLGACFIIAGSAILRARTMRKTALRAQQITLGAAIFDRSGRILVNTDGLIPSTVVTDSFLEKHAKEGFSIGHPLFHWMFHASRNWNGISNLIGGMRQHLAQLPHLGREKDRRDIQLINEHGELIDDYDIIFRELFCMAACSLADRLREHITAMGVLWDEILPTGTIGKRLRGPSQKNSSRKSSADLGDVHSETQYGTDMEKAPPTWEPDYGRGSLMFLVRRVETDRDAERLVSAGYRFAETHQVSDIIRSNMQIKSPSFDQKLRDMATYTTRQQKTLPGVFLGFFAIRARPNSLGFEILVRRGARNLLPSMALPMLKLEGWHLQFLRQFENLPVPQIVRMLSEEEHPSRSRDEDEFAGQLSETIRALREWSQEPLFEDATLTSTVVQLPCTGEESPSQSTMIVMRLVIPIHSVLSSPTCEFVPLNFFKIHQVPAKFRQEFARGVHQEFGPIVKRLEDRRAESGNNTSGFGSKVWPFERSNPLTHVGLKTSMVAEGRRGSSPDSVQSGSTINLCPPTNIDSAQSIDSGDVSTVYPSQVDSPPLAPSYGGIMVFQEIKIDIEETTKAVTGMNLASTRSQDTMVGDQTGRKMRPGDIEMQHMGHVGTNYQIATMSPIAGARSSILRRLLLPGAVATTGAVLLYSYRPRDIPGSSSPAVPPPGFGADGSFKLPRFPRVKPRDEQLADLQRSFQPDAPEYDMLIIGGGATGAGVALDAATRGLKVAVIERDDFSSGTSSKSTKLAVWNLDYSQYQLVKEALKERNSWLPIMLPLDKWWKAPYYWAGTKFYDILAGSEGIESSYFLTRSKALEAFPMLKRTDLVGALVYYDGAHNDSRMNVSIAMTAALYGATVVNHTEVTSLIKDDQGRLCGAKVKDLVAVKDGRPTKEITVRAKSVINCTGPFTDSIRKMDDQECKDIVAPSSGVHVILPGYFSPGKMGLIDPSTSDGRVIFFLPWQGNTIAGTTDSPSTISPNPLPDEKSIEWILSEVGQYLSPEINVRRGDVLAAWSGIRPLVKDPKAKNTESLVRNHLIDISASGLLTCAGGKWTTYRQMAEECVDAAISEFGLKPTSVTDAPRVSGTEMIDDGAILDGTCQTHKVRLVGAHGFSNTLFIPLIQHFGVETEVAKHLTESYGDRAWTVAGLCKLTDKRFPARGERISHLYPFVDGEIRYAVRHEYAQTAVDVLARRTRLAFLNAQAALEALPKVIDIMAEELKWDGRRQDHEWKESVAFLESMGLPQPMLSATRKQVEQGKLDFANSLEWKMYSRHDKPIGEE
ncbi:FAD dependent oxidoreductase-domain-containing protein [Dactylonectria macrodidyma]|uniref:Glycerol-3-phosphate dehydrogenase n=1 Tax=Dactylonectria macrodidyma TaxID=307937 RepID=A0A9P9J8U8_9HYPO|nr:FAD dependent oxidoreductase-domain-containing protein [Dactylonectria macrodidyma]